MILDPNGKEIKSQKYDVCPVCGRGPDHRIPSGGFGLTYFICKCGHEFKELVCPTIVSS